MTNEDLLSRLEERAEHHGREAERYRIAAEVVRAELRRASGGRVVSRERAEPADPRRSSMAMVEAILTETKRAWHVAQLVEEMQRRGWQTASATPVNNARSAAHRLVQQERIQRQRDGAFVAKDLSIEPVRATEDQKPDSDPWASTPAAGHEEPPF